MRFFVGLHQPSDAKHFEASFISVNRMRPRKRVEVSDWILDSGAFTEVATHGGYRDDVHHYAAEIARWRQTGNLLAAVTQDFMCEPEVLARTRLTIVEHQQFTVERFWRLRDRVAGVYVMPVLQGYSPAEYVRCIELYGRGLKSGSWCGVGSVCKRNGDVGQIEEVLLAIKRARPDLLLHGFGLKTTALGSGLVRRLLHTADSMAWSLHARKNGRSANDWREAQAFVRKIETMPYQESLLS